MPKIKLSILTSIILLFSTIIFIACTNEDEINSKNQFNSANLKINLKNYVEENHRICSEISSALITNSGIRFKSDFAAHLNSCKTENDVKELIDNQGLKNSQIIFALLKESIANQNKFRQYNPSFYQLSPEKKLEILNNTFEMYVKNKENIKNQKTLSCASSYNTSISRCNRDYTGCAVVAVLAAADGIIPGLIAGGYCMWSHSNCLQDASNDYEACKN